MDTNEFLPHVQGLRAVAILTVVLFHLFPSLVPGGFIGVDIFFVISGYLISGIIYRGLAASTFSIADFYVRRIRRIFPALMLVMASCLVLGYAVLVPGELEQLGLHAVAGAGFLSNVMLWHEAGYFDNSAASKPLLHLWSLSVEEQFYIVWPVFVLLAWKHRRVFVPLTIALALASFAYNLSQVDNNPLASFYSPLSRFWEIAVGSLLAYRHFQTGPQARLRQARGAGGVSLAGIAALLAACYVVSATMPYPGVWALLPVAATALLLEAGPAAPINRGLLSSAPMLWLGSISYPLYLWHWPLYCFGYILQNGQPTLGTRLLALAAGVVLAHLTYVWIEQRIQAATGARRWASVLACLMLSVAGIGYAIDFHSGYPQRQMANLGKYLPQETSAKQWPVAVVEARYPDVHMVPDSPETAAALNIMHAKLKADVQYIGKLMAEKNQLQRYTSCHIYDLPGTAPTFAQYLQASAGCLTLAHDKKNILVLGDSAAAEAYLAMARAYPEMNFVQITGSACKPFHAAYKDISNRCVEMLDHAITLAERSRFDAIVVTSQWRDDFRLALPELLRLQGKGKGTPLLLIGPPLMFSEDVANAMLRLERGASLSRMVETMTDKTNFAYAAAMRTFAQQHGFAYLDRVQLYCDGGCPLLSPNGVPMILDQAHLSLAGIDLLGARMKSRKVLEAILPAPSALASVAP